MKAQTIVIYVLLVALGLFLGYMALLSEGSYGGADSFMHYYIAKYAWQNPELLLDHWGKPLFTLFASPWAAFGFIGIRFFNISCGLAGGYFAFATAKQLGFKFPIFAGILALTATLGPPVWLSGLTEPLFALVLILSVYFGAKSNWIVSAVLISFIPLVRTEGVIFIPLWFLALAWLKKYKVLPWLITGIFVYSLIGGIAGIGLNWIWAGSPYSSEPIYGSGELLHFWSYRDATFGQWYVFFFFLGIGFLLSQWRLFKKPSAIGAAWVLLVLSFLGYFTAHSVVWFLGTGSSAGLTRVLVGIIPVGAVVASAGAEIVTLIPFKKIAYVAWPLFIVVGFLQFKTGINGAGNLAIPTKWGVEEVALQEMVSRVENRGLTNNFVVYYNPILAFMLDLNPFNQEQSREKVINPEVPEQDLPKGTLVFYDNHFGPNEGNLPQIRLDTNSNFTLLDSVPAPFEHRMGNGDWYQVYLYQKVK